MPRKKKVGNLPPHQQAIDCVHGPSSSASNSPSMSSSPSESIEDLDGMVRAHSPFDKAKFLQFIEAFRELQIAKASYLVDSELYIQTIHNFCQDARGIIIRCAGTPTAEKHQKLSKLAHTYYNRKHAIGQKFLDAALIFLELLIPSTDIPLLPNATNVSIRALTTNRSKSGNFLYTNARLIEQPGSSNGYRTPTSNAADTTGNGGLPPSPVN